VVGVVTTAHPYWTEEVDRMSAPFQTVVVGADDSPTARQAVTVAADLAQLLGATLHIVTSYDPKSVRIQDLPSEFRLTSTVHPADLLLESLSAIAAERGLEAVVHPTTDGPAEGIVHIAESVDADLIVVGNRGMKGTRRVLGSVPNSVAHGAHCSVLIVDTEAAG
jgi:nucleotide-binding universal stress UspA family protein